MNFDEHGALDDMLGELTRTCQDDQYMAALNTLAQRVSHYYLSLLCNGVGPEGAAVLTLDYQRTQLGLRP